jgi:hypothetical protein
MSAGVGVGSGGEAAVATFLDPVQPNSCRILL